jgi:hypothetical protein
MKTKYEVTARHRQHPDASHTVWRETVAEVEEWVEQHRNESTARGEYGYIMTTLRMTDTEHGWQRVAEEVIPWTAWRMNSKSGLKS